MILVSVVIPTYKDHESLHKCLLALESQTLEKEIFEVLVINNDGTAGVDLGKFDLNIRVYDEPKPGSYSARNRGISESTGRYIAFTDADCIPSEGWLESAIARIKRENLDRVAGNIKFLEPKRKLNLAEMYEKVTGFDQKLNASRGVSVTANLVIHRKIFLKAGLFDEKLKSGGDFEFGKRASSYGYGICFAEDVVVYHPLRGDLEQVKKKTRRIVAGNIDQFAGKNKVLYFLGLMAPPKENIKRILTFHDPKLSFMDRASLISFAVVVKLYALFCAVKFSFFDSTRPRV